MGKRVLYPDGTPGSAVWENVLHSSKEQKAIRVIWTKTLKVERWGWSLGCEETGGMVRMDLPLRVMGILKDFKQRNNMIKIMLLVAPLVTMLHVFRYVSFSKLLCFSKPHVWGAGNTLLVGYVGSEWQKAYNIHGAWSHAKHFLRTCLSLPFSLHDWLHL